MHADKNAVVGIRGVELVRLGSVCVEHRRFVQLDGLGVDEDGLPGHRGARQDAQDTCAVCSAIVLLLFSLRLLLFSPLLLVLFFFIFRTPEISFSISDSGHGFEIRGEQFLVFKQC